MKNIEHRIIELLKESGNTFLSGQDISSSLSVSRSAVWKHIKALRSSGYSIDAQTRKGYRLVSHPELNEIEILSGLTTEFIGQSVEFLLETDSTNIQALRLARAGAKEGTVVAADSQSKGKGRLGREWISPKGVNLYTSVILRPPTAPHEAQAYSLLSGVALAEAIEECSSIRPTVKWPNDVLLGGLKVGGILLEMSSDTDTINHLVIGIGVNLNMDVTDTPEEIRSIATSIYLKSGKKVDRTKFAQLLYSRLEKWYKVILSKGSEPICEAWRAYFDLEGKKVRLSSGRDKAGTTTEGICMGIDPDGAILIRTKGGELQRVVAGDLTPASY